MATKTNKELLEEVLIKVGRILSFLETEAFIQARQGSINFKKLAEGTDLNDIHEREIDLDEVEELQDVLDETKERRKYMPYKDSCNRCNGLISFDHYNGTYPMHITKQGDLLNGNGNCPEYGTNGGS